MMVLFVAIFNRIQNFQCLFRAGRLYHHFLEAAFQSTVFFNVHTVLIQRRRSDALKFATGQSGLEHVGSIQRSRSTACTYDSMQFINKKNHIIGLLQLGHNGLHAFLKLTAVFGTRDNGTHIQRNDAFIMENTRHLFFNDAQTQTFGNGRFTNAGLSYEHRIILFSAGQNLRYPLNFFIPADNRIKLTFDGQLG